MNGRSTRPTDSRACGWGAWFSLLRRSPPLSRRAKLPLRRRMVRWPSCRTSGALSARPPTAPGGRGSPPKSPATQETPGSRQLAVVSLTMRDPSSYSRPTAPTLTERPLGSSGMTCPRCQAENDAGARFCEDCGARLEAACPSCGIPVTPGKKFCRSCGAALTPEPSRFTSPESYTPKHLAEKILTSKSVLEGSASRSPCCSPI
jgi:hypothetical protein